MFESITYTVTLLVTDEPADEATTRLLHQTIDVVRADLEALRFNTAVARLIQLNNALTLLAATPRAIAEPLVLMLAPLAPHLAEELWQRLGHPESLAHHPFPVADPAWVQEDTVTYPVQINGKVRSRVTVPADADEATVRAAALGDAAVLVALNGKEPRKIIIVPGRMVSLVG